MIDIDGVYFDVKLQWSAGRLDEGGEQEILRVQAAELEKAFVPAVGNKQLHPGALGQQREGHADTRRVQGRCQMCLRMYATPSRSTGRSRNGHGYSFATILERQRAQWLTHRGAEQHLSHVADLFHVGAQTTLTMDGCRAGNRMCVKTGAQTICLRVDGGEARAGW